MAVNGEYGVSCLIVRYICYGKIRYFRGLAPFSALTEWIASLIEASTFVYFAILFAEVFAKFWRIQHLAGGCKHHMSGYGDELLM